MKPDAAGTWTYHFDNLDVVDDAGNVIAYTVSEEPVEGYETTIEGSNITNTRTPEVVEIPVTKVGKTMTTKMAFVLTRSLFVSLRMVKK